MRRSGYWYRLPSLICAFDSFLTLLSYRICGSLHNVPRQRKIRMKLPRVEKPCRYTYLPQIHWCKRNLTVVFCPASKAIVQESCMKSLNALKHAQQHQDEILRQVRRYFAANNGATGSNAGGDRNFISTPIAKCRECGKDMTLKTIQNGRFLCGCEVCKPTTSE